MMKWLRMNPRTGECIVVLGITEENVRRLKQDRPIAFEPAQEGWPLFVQVEGAIRPMRHMGIMWQETEADLRRFFEEQHRKAGSPLADVQLENARPGIDELLRKLVERIGLQHLDLVLVIRDRATGASGHVAQIAEPLPLGDPDAETSALLVGALAGICAQRPDTAPATMDSIDAVIRPLASGEPAPPAPKLSEAQMAALRGALEAAGYQNADTPRCQGCGRTPLELSTQGHGTACQ